MLNLDLVKEHALAGHSFYWDSMPFTRRYQLRAVTHTYENGNARTKGVYIAPDYEAAQVACQALQTLSHYVPINHNTESLEKLANERFWATGSRRMGALQVVDLYWIHLAGRVIFWPVLARPGRVRRSRLAFEHPIDAAIYGLALADRFRRIFGEGGIMKMDHIADVSKKES